MRRLLLFTALALVASSGYAQDKISSFSNASAQTGTELITEVQGGANVNTTPAQLATYINTHSVIPLGTGVSGNLPLANQSTISSPAVLCNNTGSTGTPNGCQPLAVINMSQVMMIAHLVSVSTNVTLSGVQTIDGVATANGTVVLLRGQTTASQNGLWIASSSGAWTRPPFYPSGYAIASGCDIDVFVEAGNTYANTVWNTQPVSTATIDTTATTWNEVTVAATSARLGTTLTTAGSSSSPASQYLTGGHTPSGSWHDCASFADVFGSIFDSGDVTGTPGPCATENGTTFHLQLSNGGFPAASNFGTINPQSGDHWGVITGLSSITSVTVTFSSPYPTVVSCTVNGSTAIAWGVTYTTVSSTITAAVFTPASSFTGSLSYLCFGIS